MTETMLERMARAMSYSWSTRMGLKSERVWAAQSSAFIGDAKAALQAIREPSVSMLNVTSHVDLDFAAEPSINDARIWRAGVDAILSGDA